MLASALGYAVELRIVTSNPLERTQWKAAAVAEAVDRRGVANPAQIRDLLAAVRAQGDRGQHMEACLSARAGWKTRGRASWPLTGPVTSGPYPQAIGGFTVGEVQSREEALKWAAKVGVACRCAQEVWEIGFDPELDAMLRQADSRQ